MNFIAGEKEILCLILNNSLTIVIKFQKSAQIIWNCFQVDFKDNYLVNSQKLRDDSIYCYFYKICRKILLLYYYKRVFKLMKFKDIILIVVLVESLLDIFLPEHI